MSCGDDSAAVDPETVYWVADPTLFAPTFSQMVEQISLLKRMTESTAYSEAVRERDRLALAPPLAVIEALGDPTTTIDQLFWKLERVRASFNEICEYCKTNTCPPEGVVAERAVPREPDPRPWPLLSDWYPRPMYD